MVAPLFIPPILMAGASAQNYIINGSALFDGATGYLSRTPSVAGNRRTWVLEMIFKRAALGVTQQLFTARTDGNNTHDLAIQSNGQLYWQDYDAGVATPAWRFDANFKLNDPGAYYHLILAVDTTQAVAANRCRAFLNGVQLTDWSVETQPTLNYESAVGVNTTNPHRIGSNGGSTVPNDFFEGYIARVALYDGLAITNPASAGMGELTPDGYWRINDVSKLNLDRKASFTPSSSNDYTGNTGAFTIGSGTLDRGTGANVAILSSNQLIGDFDASFKWDTTTANQINFLIAPTAYWDSNFDQNAAYAGLTYLTSFIENNAIGFQCANANTIAVFDSVGQTNPIGNLATNDRIRITRVGSLIRLYKNEALHRTIITTLSTETMKVAYATSSAYGMNISEINETSTEVGGYLNGNTFIIEGQDVATGADSSPGDPTQTSLGAIGPWAGATGQFGFSGVNIMSTGTVNRSCYSDATFSGDFAYNANVAVSLGGFGVFADSELVTTWNETDDNGYGALDSMTNSFWVDRSSNARIGGATDGASLGIADGSNVELRREGGMITLWDDGVLLHTFTTSYSGVLRAMFGAGNSSWYANNIAKIEKKNFSRHGTITATNDSPTDSNSQKNTYFAALDPNLPGSQVTLSEGNTRSLHGPDDAVTLTLPLVDGVDMAVEVEVLANPGAGPAGVALLTAAKRIGITNWGLENFHGYQASEYAYKSDGTIRNNNISATPGPTYTAGDIIGIRRDAGGNITFYKNGLAVGGNPSYSGITGELFAAVVNNASSLSGSEFRIRTNQDDWVHSYGDAVGVSTTTTGVGNFPTLNPLDNIACVGALSNGNRTVVTGSSEYGPIVATYGVEASTADHFWTVTVDAKSGSGEWHMIGIIKSSDPRISTTAELGNTANGYGYYGFNGQLRNNAASTSYGATYAVGDEIGVSLVAGTLKFYKWDGSAWSDQGIAATGLSGVFLPAIGDWVNNQTSTFTINFDPNDWASAAPNAEKSPATQNMPTIGVNTAEHVAVVLYDGDGTGAKTITGFGFDPDLAIAKGRNDTNNWFWADSVRGANANIRSDSTALEANPTTDFANGGIGSVTTDGFTAVAGTSNTNNLNGSGINYFALGLKAGGPAVANNDGTIAAQVSANPTLGFSIVKVPAGTHASGTIGHGLPTDPALIIGRPLTTLSNWPVYCREFANPTDYLHLDETTGLNPGPTNRWSATPADNSVIRLGAWTGWNDELVFYCFAETDIIKIGSYTGNGSTDGPFVNLGGRPLALITKNADASGHWYLSDSAREPYNQMTNWLALNSTQHEQPGVDRDFVSTGSKCRDSEVALNGSGNKIIYLAVLDQLIQGGTAAVDQGCGR